MVNLAPSRYLVKLLLVILLAAWACNALADERTDGLRRQIQALTADSNTFIKDANAVIARATALLPGADAETKKNLKEIIDEANKLIAQKRVNEAFDIGALRMQILLGAAEQKIPDIGEALCNGFSPVARLPIGDTCSLSFQFIDTLTGLPTAGGPTVGSVFYEVQTDPDHPDVFTPIGTSTDAASQFAMSFINVDFEPLVLAIPFDPAGGKIFIDDGHGSNLAAGDVVLIPPGPVPEPSSWSVLLLGLPLLGLSLCKRDNLQATAQ
jgi:hypothetical protein